MADMLTKDIELNDGHAMPRLGLGVWQTPAGEAARIMREAIGAGYRAVDTASAYNNEEGVGEGLAGTDVFLTTKLWNADQGYDAALRAFEASLGRLGRESVDLYLIHWPAPRKGLYVDSWKALVRLRAYAYAASPAPPRSPATFSIAKGEIVGFFGLIGAGRTEVCRAIFGLDPIDAGEVVLEGAARVVDAAPPPKPTSTPAAPVRMRCSADV